MNKKTKNRHGVLLGGENALRRIRNIKGVIFDVDGVLTDNRVPEGGDSKIKYRNYSDGQGVSLLRAIGIRVCLITSEEGVSAKHIVDVVKRWNNFTSSMSKNNKKGWSHVRLFTGMSGKEKIVAAEKWFKDNGLTWDVCAVMGDDLVDFPIMKKALFRATPMSGELVVKDISDFVSRRNGGDGAVRDFSNFILESRGIDQTLIDPK